MTQAAKKISTHPYITKKKGVCGGRSIVRGTRIPVWSLIQWYKQGMSIEDIMREFPQLKPSQVHDAFSYYYDNRKEIEKDIIENETEAHSVAS
jgi:type III restriction enzyme